MLQHSENRLRLNPSNILNVGQQIQIHSPRGDFFSQVSLSSGRPEPRMLVLNLWLCHWVNPPTFVIFHRENDGKMMVDSGVPCCQTQPQA